MQFLATTSLPPVFVECQAPTFLVNYYEKMGKKSKVVRRMYSLVDMPSTNGENVGHEVELPMSLL